jgi:hypothetical protein
MAAVRPSNLRHVLSSSSPQARAPTILARAGHIGEIAAAAPLALPSTLASAADMPAKAPAASANSPNFLSGAQAGCS